MSTDCEMFGHPHVVGDGCPCGFHAPATAPELVVLPAADRVWWAGIPRLNFGLPVQTCEHPTIASHK